MLKRPLLLTIVFLGLLTLLIVGLISRFPDTLQSRHNLINLVSLVALLIYLGLGLSSRRISLSQTGKQALGWIALFMLILLGYSYRQPLQSISQRLLYNLWPARGEALADGSIRFPLSDNGHFMIEASVDGVPIRFMLDTGASRVVLSKEDAQRIGIDVNALTFNQPTNTANGMVLTAPITINSLSIGPIHVYNVRAAVNEADAGGSLLGMSFLEKIKKYEVSNGQLILRN